MSIVLTRSPLEMIGMNGGAATKRRSARLSQEDNGENEPPAKKTKVNGSGASTTVTTKQQDGEGSKFAGKKKRKVYNFEDDGFQYASKGRRAKTKEKGEIDSRMSNDDNQAVEPVVSAPSSADLNSEPADDAAPKTSQKKTRRRFPTTPEREVPDRGVRRSQRLSDERVLENVSQKSPQRLSHARSHANTERGRSPSPGKARPLTIEKKRKQGVHSVEEEKVMMITLPFADTPIIRRNKEMRKTSAEGHRRSSAGMRGKRASSLIDEGRGHALPHEEVLASEFFKHISADLAEPRRMRLLLGWCGSRALPTRPEPSQDSSSASGVELQALHAACVVQEEMSQELIRNGILSDWFSRDESAPPQVPLRKKPNPRNVANAAKADELERELKRLRNERAGWDELEQSATSTSFQHQISDDENGQLSPVRPEVLDSSQRAIYDRFQSLLADLSIEPETIEHRLQAVSNDLEFAIDLFAHGIHGLSTTRQTAERLAERSLANAATALDEREKQRAAEGKPVNQMDALRGLARALNSQGG